MNASYAEIMKGLEDILILICTFYGIIVIAFIIQLIANLVVIFSIRNNLKEINRKVTPKEEIEKIEEEENFQKILQQEREEYIEHLRQQNAEIRREKMQKTKNFFNENPIMKICTIIVLICLILITLIALFM